MPIYLYQCRNCQEVREYFVPKIGQRPDACLECSSPDLNKVYDRQVFGVPRGDANVYVENDSPNEPRKPESPLFTITSNFPFIVAVVGKK